MPAHPALDLDPFDLDARQAASANRRALFWLFGLLALVLASTVALALFLGDVEAQEAERRRASDAEWLDQTLRFHFHRLERDLTGLARAAPAPGGGDMARLASHAGALWRGPGVIVHHGWVPAEQQALSTAWPALLQAAAQVPEQAAALAVMLDTARGLQRPAYAGPLPPAAQPAAGVEPRLLWVALPRVEQGRFLGSYLAAVDVDLALAQVVPQWFLTDHALADEAAPPPGAGDSAQRYRVPVGLPGAQWTLAVTGLQDQPALAPRAFFAAALVCLLGMAAALAFLWRDVAQRRRAESRLRTQMALRSAMERSVALGLRAWDMDGRLLFVNQAFCQLVGWSAAELLGRTGPGPHWPPDQGEEWGPPGDADREGREVRLRHRDGHGLDVLLHTAPLTQPDGRQIGWIGSVLDITERKRIERLAAQQQEQLEASGRLVVVGEVASTLAHELNQPLGALSSFATGLLNRLQAGRIGADEIVPVVERMARMADKAGRVIQRVNAFARRQEMTRQPLALNGFVRRVVAQVHGPEGVALALKPPATDPVLPADALLLEHALHNLVLNALEWAGQGPSGPARVRVSWWATEAEAAVRVEDSGPGVPPEQHAQVFEAFHSRKPGGMGMGLAICRSIVEAHHGRIEVGRSATLGGAQFTLWLPLNP